MKAVLNVSCLFFSAVLAFGQGEAERLKRMENSGDTAAARATLANAAAANPTDAATLTRFAEFQDRYGDPTAKIPIAGWRLSRRIRQLNAAWCCWI